MTQPLIGLDVGTTGVKAVAIDHDGHLLGATSQEYALSTPQPLTLHILGARSDPRLRSVKQLTVEVRNSSDGPLSPHFATNARGQASPFWRVTRGPASLAW